MISSEPSSGITQKELARLANVSLTTLYNALHSKEKVKESTRNRIYSIMEELDYHPNGMARAMVSQRSNVLGILMPRYDLLYYSRLASYIESGVSSVGLNTFFCQHYDDLFKERQEISMMRQRRVDGLVIRPGGKMTKPDIYQNLEKAGLPFVLVDRLIRGMEDYFVGYDTISASEKLVNFLADKGHQRISLVYWPENTSEKGAKYNAVINAMQKRGITPEPDIFIECTAEYEGSYYPTLYMLEKLGKKKPTAIIAFNDPAVVGVIHALNHLGICVGKDISVVHFGGYFEEHFMALMPIQFTCVIQPAEALARESVRLLLGQMNGKKPSSGPTLCPVELRIGNSA